MTGLIQDARHPRLPAILENWERSRNKINLEDFSKLSDIPEIQSITSAFSKTEKLLALKNQELPFSQKEKLKPFKFDYIPPSRDIVAAHAIRSVAKSLEAFDAATFCNDTAITSSAMLLAYNSAFFAAKSFCYLCGFTPINRDSRLTLDVFIETSQENTNLAYKYGRWGHSEVWELTKRLIETFKGGFESERRTIRKAKPISTPKLRNAYSYNESTISMFKNNDFLDYPDFSIKTSPTEFTKSIDVTKALLGITITIINEANMRELLETQASPRRLKLVA